jgi:exosortase D (VPLPA-CTERM-specific)
MHSVQLRSTYPGYALLAVALIAAALLFAQALGQLYAIWNVQPEYSYGILIPVLTLFLIWRERGQLRGLPFTGSWYGLSLIVAGLLFRIIGQLGTMHAVVHYAFLLVLYGLVLALVGPVIFRRLLMPLLILIFMVPLPPFFSEQLSLQLQLLSSQLGVQVIRAYGISVFLEGNVIDLGSYQLEVAEACSGLRYLFPLMTLSFLIAYMFGGPLWKRAIVFFSSVPITVLMNSLRIGVIGITVEHWGPQMAEGFLHEFEGWAVFMVSSAVVLLIAVTLTKPWRKTVPTGTAAGTDLKPVAKARVASLHGPDLTLPFRSLPRSFVAATILVTVGAGLVYALPERVEIPPARAQFVDFPNQIGGMPGARETLSASILDALRLDDYLLVDYHGADGIPVNLYVAYYQSQNNGLSIHSPRRCLPAGGWEVQKFERYIVHPPGSTQSWPVNRVLIQQGGQRELVYYWFQERGRRLTNEYVVRWYMFWDALTRNRTDGALVRLVVPIPKGAPEADLDAKLARFAALSEPPLRNYVPD